MHPTGMLSCSDLKCNIVSCHLCIGRIHCILETIRGNCNLSYFLHYSVKGQICFTPSEIKIILNGSIRALNDNYFSLLSVWAQGHKICKVLVIIMISLIFWS